MGSLRLRAEFGYRCRLGTSRKESQSQLNLQHLRTPSLFALPLGGRLGGAAGRNTGISVPRKGPVCLPEKLQSPSGCRVWPQTASNPQVPIPPLGQTPPTRGWGAEEQPASWCCASGGPRGGIPELRHTRPSFQNTHLALGLLWICQLGRRCG